MTTQSQQPDPREEDARQAREVDDALSAMRDEAEREAMREPIEPPVWRYWVQHGALELWALVALSMNLQPVLIKRLAWFGPEPSEADRFHPMVRVNTEKIVEGTEGFVTEKRPKRDERIVDHRIERLPRLLDSSAFAQRLDLAVSWLNRENGLRTVAQPPAAAPERALIAPRVFLSWARHRLPVHEAMLAVFAALAEDAEGNQPRDHIVASSIATLDTPTPPAAGASAAAAVAGDMPTSIPRDAGQTDVKLIEPPANVEAYWQRIAYAHIGRMAKSGRKVSVQDALTYLAEFDSQNLSEERPEKCGPLVRQGAALYWRTPEADNGGKPARWRAVQQRTVENVLSEARKWSQQKVDQLPHATPAKASSEVKPD
jgi:hypothetical protein